MTAVINFHTLLPMVENPNAGGMPVRHPDFAKRLQAAMAARGISVTDIKNELKITYEMARRYSLGLALPRKDKLDALAQLVGKTSAYLAYGEYFLTNAVVQSRDVGPKIRRLREQRKVDLATLAHSLGLEPRELDAIEWGQRVCDVEILTDVAEFFGLAPEDILDSEPVEAPSVEPGPDFRNERTYPVISWVQAGEWTELCDNFAPGDAEEWKPCHKDLGKCGYVLRVKGKSMTAPPGEPYTFPEGILLYVNAWAEPLPGQFVVVRRNKTQEATFKKYILVDGEPYLEALNPEWPNRYLKLNEGDVFCGVVMHAGFDMP